MGSGRTLCKHFTPSVCGGGRGWPANMRRWPNAGLMLSHLLRRWPNINTASGQCFVFAGWSAARGTVPPEVTAFCAFCFPGALCKSARVPRDAARNPTIKARSVTPRPPRWSSHQSRRRKLRPASRRWLSTWESSLSQSGGNFRSPCQRKAKSYLSGSRFHYQTAIRAKDV